MNRAFRVLILLFLITGLLGCGTLQLNHIITGTECATREDCINDLHMPNPEQADIVIVVEPFHIDRMEGKNAFGTLAPDSFRLVADLDLCLLQALSEKFPNAAIKFSDSSGKIHVKIKDAGVKWGPKAYLEYTATIDGREIAGTVTKFTLFTISQTKTAAKSFPYLCGKIAERIKLELATKNVEK